MKISRLRTAIATFALLFSGVFLFGQERQIVLESVNGSGGQKYAFLVGVSEYEESEKLRSLPYTVKDVEAWQKQLESIGFPSRNVVVMASNTTVPGQPTKRKIQTSFKELLSRVGENDIIICMFSGHGVQVEKKPYFCPEDARSDDIKNSCVYICTFKKIE